MAKVSIDDLLRWRWAQPVEAPAPPPIEMILERARRPWWERLSTAVDAAMSILRSMPKLMPVSAASGLSGSATIRVVSIRDGEPISATLLEFEVSEGRVVLSLRLPDELISNVGKALFVASGNVRFEGAVQCLDTRTLRITALVPEKLREEWALYSYKDVMPFDLLLNDIDTLE